MNTAEIALRNALGSTIFEALEDPKTQDVNVHDDGRIWLYRDGKWDHIGDLTEDRRRTVLEMAAHFAGRVIRSDRASLSAILPFGNIRLKGMIPPAAPAPQFYLRRPSDRLIPLEDYVENRIMTPTQARFLTEAAGRKTVLFCGPVGEGKSTLMNTFISLPGFDGLHCVMAQDEDEIRNPRISSKVFTNHEIDPPRTMSDCVRDALRMRAQAIFVGEVSDEAARALVMTWNTGTKGAATVHCNSARAGLLRIKQLTGPPGYRMDEDEIRLAVNVLVFIRQYPGGARKVEEIVAVEPDGAGGWRFIEVG